MEKSMVQKLKDQFITFEFIKFVFVGIINTFNGTIFSYLYSMYLNPNISFIGGYITSLCIAYFLNSKFIFQQSITIKRGIKFAMSYIPNFIIQNIVVIIIYNILGYPELIAYIIAAILGIPITFLCVKLFVFNKRYK